MSPEQTIQPINVAGATLLVQVLLVSILGIGGRIFKSGWTRGSDRLDHLAFEGLEPLPLKNTPLTLLAVVTFTLLLLSSDLYSIWSPLFQGLGINTIATSKAIMGVYVLNLFIIGYLMMQTGGSASSPFVSALFTIPALAIFLRMPPSGFMAIAVMTVLIYLFLLAPGFEKKQISQSPAAFMNIACLVLAMLTGYVTRPIPINELATTNQVKAEIN